MAIMLRQTAAHRVTVAMSLTCAVPFAAMGFAVPAEARHWLWSSPQCEIDQVCATSWMRALPRSTFRGV